VEYNLSKLVESISSFSEVIAIILFGSIARGDYDEYSDYDILVIFKDRESMWRRWDSLFEAVGKLRLVLHLIPKSYEEFINSEPTFLNEVYKHGTLLYSKYPFKTSLKSVYKQHKRLITYDLSGISQNDKVKLIYRLYGKRGTGRRGLLKSVNGYRLANGCLLVPADKADIIIQTLRKYNVKMKILDIYI